MNRSRKNSRTGVTLLEVMTAVGISATLMASSFVVLRSCYAAWEAHEADSQESIAVTALASHIVRQARQSTSIDNTGFYPGTITMTHADGSVMTWTEDGDSITYSVNGSDPEVLVQGVDYFFPFALTPDGTNTFQYDEAKMVRLFIASDLPQGGFKSVFVSGWLRSW